MSTMMIDDLKVFFIDDDPHMREANQQSLQLAGFDVTDFPSAEASLKAVENSEDLPDVIVCDVRLSGMSGLDFLEYWQKHDEDLPIILITGHGDIEMAVSSLQNGAYDFIAKPYDSERLIEAILRAGEKRRLVLENRQLRLLAQGAHEHSPLIGETRAMERLRQTIRQLADTDVDVLIEGETGTGKEVAANLLHQWGKRAAYSFVALNCGAFPETLIESELFGHEAGAFTGAVKKRVGLIEGAQHGTLFLDEIESMPLSVQVRFLRVLENRSVHPLGTNRPVDVDFRVVAATKIDLAQAANQGQFRDDLFYRLNVVTLRIPPLRERRDDIPLLLSFYLEKAARRFNRDVPSIPLDIYRMIENYDWPGNVRELVHLAERLVLGVADIHVSGRDEQLGMIDRATLGEQMDAHEAAILRATLRRFNGSVQETIDALGLPRKTFYDKLTRHGIRRRDYAE